jgi:hypothetical protein
MDKDSRIWFLEEEIKQLKDENESLWDMLDEIQKSNSAVAGLLEEPTIEMALEILASGDPVGEA